MGMNISEKPVASTFKVDADSLFLWNIGPYPPNCTTPQLRRL